MSCRGLPFFESLKRLLVDERADDEAFEDGSPILEREEAGGGGAHHDGPSMPPLSVALKYGCQFLGQMCCIVCPPLPDRITAKLAFYPPDPPTYRIEGSADGEAWRKMRNIDEAKTFKFLQLKIQNQCTLFEERYEILEERIRPFVVESKSGNNLLAIHIEAHDERLNALRGTEVVMLFAQPNGSDVGGFLRVSKVTFADMADIFGCQFYSFDYSGHGLSSGQPTERAIYADTQTMLEHKDLQIILMGYSLGTAAIVDVASRDTHGVAGVILIAPFLSGIHFLRGTAEDCSLWSLDRFRTIDKIASIDVPVLLVHGADDQVASARNSVVLSRRLQHNVKPLFLHRVDHYNIFEVWGEKRWKKLQNMTFFREAGEFIAWTTTATKEKKDKEEKEATPSSSRLATSTPTESVTK